MKKAISARIDEEILTYVKKNHNNLNRLINNLLYTWMENNKKKQTNLNL